MYRKELIPLLLRRAWTVSELAEHLDVDTREMADDLVHLERSLRHLPYRMQITPAQCRKCGFVFDRERLRKPGKCPSCRGTWISEPQIGLEPEA